MVVNLSLSLAPTYNLQSLFNFTEKRELLLAAFAIDEETRTLFKCVMEKNNS